MHRFTLPRNAGNVVFAALACSVALVGCDREQGITGSSDLDAPLFASSSALPHVNNTNLPLPVSVSADLVAYDCSNNPGPQITFEGATVLGGFGVEMTFSNNMKGTHEYTADNVVDATVMDAGEAIEIPKQPVQGGTGGNPFIWVQFINGDGSAATDEIFVGRCVQGAGWHVTGPTSTQVSAWAEFIVESCENSPGPFISFNSGMTMAGLTARIIFRNNDNPVGGPHEADVTRDITLVGAGTDLTFPKQPVLGGVGGNPWIFAAFADGNGTPLSEATLLGRCVQLNNALSG